MGREMPNANARPLRSPHAGRAALFAAGLAAITFLFASAQVPCGFARMFHVPCPGCGSTRAMLALAHGDLHGVIRYNPLAPFMTALIVVLALQAFKSLLATRTFRGLGDGTAGKVVTYGMLLIATLEVVLWIARFSGFLGGPVPV